MKSIAALATAGLLALTALPAPAAEMLMLEQPGCAWCKRFNAEIAPAWPNTDEGKAAPLRRSPSAQAARSSASLWVSVTAPW